jgi:hypothetical protein
LIGPRNPSWFTKESTRVPRDECGPRPKRSPKEQAEYEALKRERESGSRLIKAGEQVRRKAPYKPKKKRKSPSITTQPLVHYEPQPVVVQSHRGKSRIVEVERGAMLGKRSKLPQSD